jgi:CRP-like cAMP-binding protein
MMPPVAANTDFLKRVQLFEDLDSKTLDSIANAAVEQSYAAGQDIVRQGDTGVGAFIIRSGRVAILQEHGGEEHEISQMKTGDFFGDMALLDEFPRSATVRAVEPTTCLGITRWHFRGILESHPQLAVKMLPVLTRRIRNAEAHNHEAAAKH